MTSIDSVQKYDYQKCQFARSFNISTIYTFEGDLQCMLNSIAGFRTTWNGNQPAVKKFIEANSTIKDKSEFWGPSLLYSTARNSHIELVKYLIEHGADYFIKNHRDETSIDNARGRPKILPYFRNYSIEAKAIIWYEAHAGNKNLLEIILFRHELSFKNRIAGLKHEWRDIFEKKQKRRQNYKRELELSLVEVHVARSALFGVIPVIVGTTRITCRH